jgi:hypothetical protein
MPASWHSIPSIDRWLAATMAPGPVLDSTIA